MIDMPGEDGDDAAEWVDITTLASSHQTQLNTATGEIRHRRQRAHIDYSGYPPEVIAAMAVEDAWVPGHPPD